MSTDKRVLELIEKIKKEKAAIANSKKNNWKTNCLFPTVSDKPTNIRVVNNVSALVLLLADIKVSENEYYRTLNELGLSSKDYPYLISGYSTEEWHNDIKLQIDKILASTKKENLENLQNRLEKIMTPELKAQLELAEIEASLEDKQ